MREKAATSANSLEASASSMDYSYKWGSGYTRNASKKVPPHRPLFESATSEHMLQTSAQSRNDFVFSSKHRLVNRNLPFWQSRNQMQVHNQHNQMKLWNLLRYDWFHVWLRMQTVTSLILLLTLWTLVIFVFAGIYMRIDRRNINTDCGLGPVGEPIEFGPAFAFSLETCTTVGYGLPSGSNSFFEDGCETIQLAIYFQMVWSMLFNAFLFAFFYTKLAKSESRGVQVIFSNKAIVGSPPDNPFPCFQFRLFDVDSKHPLVEAHVRLYVVTQKSPVPKPLRILSPNDDLGAMLFLSLPSEVVHAMDNYSPMVPKSEVSCRASATVPPDGMNLRQVDSRTNNRDDCNCPVCGEAYGTIERLIKHGKFNKMIEGSENAIPYEGSHQEVDWDEWEMLLNKSTNWTLEQLKAYFRSTISEVICLVEGIDPLTSGTFQAVHSYQLEDIHFGKAYFADCVCFSTKKKDQLVVDLDYFHRIKEVTGAVKVKESKADKHEAKEDGTQSNHASGKRELDPEEIDRVKAGQAIKSTPSEIPNIPTVTSSEKPE